MLDARIVHSARATRRFTRITRLRVEGLDGGERIVVTCSSRGCPYRRRAVTAGRAGTVNLQRPFRRRKLRRGTIVRVTVTKTGFIGRSRSLTVRPRRSPLVSNGCLAAGAASATRCP